MKKFIACLLVTFLMICPTKSLSEEILKPSILFENYYSYDRVIRTPDYKIVALGENGKILLNRSPEQPIAGFKVISGAYSSSTLRRYLGRDKPSVSGIGYLGDKELLTKNSYSLIRFHTVLSGPEAIYIFGQNNVCIGYFLMDPFDISKVMNEPIIQKIKLLSENPNYLSTQISLPTGASITFYEIENQGFIERYGILTTPTGEKYLQLDAFYPLGLEGDLNQYLINSLNNIRF